MTEERALKIRNYCFTSYKVDNPLPFDETKVKYLIYQKERCPESGREHFQGYIELKSPQRISFVKNLFNDNGVHCEQRRGTREQAKDYCSKLESRVDGPWEHGVFGEGGQGKRSDLKEQAKIVRELIRENPKTFQRELVEEHPEILLKYSRGVEAIRTALETQERTWTTECELYIGKPGTGKSTLVKDKYPDAFWYSSSSKGYWDGYEGEEVVVFDEFKGWITHTEFTQLVGNSNKLRVNIKYGTRPFLAKKVIIISNYDPQFWWKEEYSFRAISRRLSKILYIISGDKTFATEREELEIREYEHKDNEHAWDQWRRDATVFNF